jgi:hypothetical protein
MRLISLLSGVLMVASAAAAETSPFSVEVQATHSGDHQILITMTITDLHAGGVTEVLSSPRILLNEGQRGTISVGTTRSPTSGPSTQPANAAAEKLDLTGSRAAAEKLDLMSQVIHAKGSDNVLMVTYVMRNDVVVWTEAKTIKIGGKTPLSERVSAVVSAGIGSGGSGSASGARIQPSNSLSARRVEVEWKYRNPAGEGEWHVGTTRMLTGGPAPQNLWELKGSVYELTQWDGKSASIRGMNGRVIPAKLGDFDSGQIQASADQFKSGGQTPYPIAVGKVFAVRYTAGGSDSPGEALIRIRSIEAGAGGSGGGGLSSGQSGGSGTSAAGVSSGGSSASGSSNIKPAGR